LSSKPLLTGAQPQGVPARQVGSRIINHAQQPFAA